MNTEEASKQRHDIINSIASALAQLELLKRKHPAITEDLLKMEEKLKSLHQNFLNYLETTKE
jgi:hypothetical protein